MVTILMALVIFVALIFFYASYMNNVLDPKYGYDVEESRTEDADPSPDQRATRSRGTAATHTA